MRRGVGTITIVAVLVATPFLPDAFWARMASIVDEESDKQFTGSREARRTVMQEGIEAFLEHPLTGVGVGQFKNYNPPERKERWLETHNVLIQVAAETGFFGLLAFSFLIIAAAAAAITTQRRVRYALRRGAARDERSRRRCEGARRAHAGAERRPDWLVRLRDVRVGCLQLDVLLPSRAGRRRPRARARPFPAARDRKGSPYQGQRLSQKEHRSAWRAAIVATSATIAAASRLLIAAAVEVVSINLLQDTVCRRARATVVSAVHSADEFVSRLSRSERRVLFEAASPLSLAVFRPVLDRLQRDPRLEFWFTTSDRIVGRRRASSAPRELPSA